MIGSDRVSRSTGIRNGVTLELSIETGCGRAVSRRALECFPPRSMRPSRSNAMR